MIKGQLEPLVSVVTPFYNTEQYLAECIESVLAQTYQNWEYILVNNCSTDKSAEIARKYAETDERIRLINNNRILSQVQNYNLALRQISQESKYCKIVQADDWIYPECLSKMVPVAEVDPSVRIVSSYVLKGRTIQNVGLPYENIILSGKKICKIQLMHGGYYFGSPSSILIKSDIVRTRVPFYEENLLHEDTYACYEILQEGKFGFVHQVLTFSRIQNESLMSKIELFDPWVLNKFIIVMKYGQKFLNLEEFEKSLVSIKKEYYRFLSNKIFSEKPDEFWKFHEEQLKTVDYKIEYSWLLKFIFLEFLDIIRSPKRLIRLFFILLKIKV